MTRKLYRSKTDCMLAGVAGGLAAYFDVDATVIRLLLLVTLIFGGSGFLLYLIAWVIIPPHPGPRMTQRFQQSEEWRDKVVDTAKRVERRLRDDKVVRPRDEQDQDPESDHSRAGVPPTDAQWEPLQEAEWESVDPDEGDPKAGDAEEDERGKTEGPRRSRWEQDEHTGGRVPPSEEDSVSESEQTRRQRMAGLALVVFGLLFLVQNVFPWFHLFTLWPVLLVGTGVVLLVREVRR